MPEFTGESRFAVEDFAVYDYAHTETPAHIHEQNMLPIRSDAGYILAECHRARVVFYGYGRSQLGFEYLAYRRMVIDEERETVSRLVVDATGKGEAVALNLGNLETGFEQMLADKP